MELTYVSRRLRRRNIGRTLRLLGDDPDLVAIHYVPAGAGPRPPQQLWSLVAAGSAAGVVTGWRVGQLSLALAVVAVVALVVELAIVRPSGLLLTNRGLASFRCRPFTGTPAALIGRHSVSELQRNGHADHGRWARVRLGDETLWIDLFDLSVLRDNTTHVVDDTRRSSTVLGQRWYMVAAPEVA